MTSYTCSTSKVLFLVSLVVICISSLISVEAFQVVQPASQKNPTTRLHAKSSSDNERRKFLSQGAGAVMSVILGGTTMIGNSQPAEASYTAYTQREEDWKQRETKGGKNIEGLCILILLLLYLHYILCISNILCISHDEHI